MGEIILQDKSVAIPGEEIARGMDFIPAIGTYRDGESILASRLGLVSIENRLIKLIALSGRYIPKRGDMILGQVVDVQISGWRVEINSPYSSMLSMKEGTQEFIERGADLTKYFDIGDWIAAKIINVTSQKLVDLTVKGPGLRKVRGGRIFKVAPSKVPRIIGKQGSMVSMIKNATNCKITIGQNGLVWVSGEPSRELIVLKVIRKIEAESHLQGLTEAIKEMLEAEGVSVTPEQFEGNSDAPEAGQRTFSGDEQNE